MLHPVTSFSKSISTMPLLVLLAGLTMGLGRCFDQTPMLERPEGDVRTSQTGPVVKNVAIIGEMSLRSRLSNCNAQVSQALGQLVQRPLIN